MFREQEGPLRKLLKGEGPLRKTLRERGFYQGISTSGVLQAILDDLKRLSDDEEEARKDYIQEIHKIEGVQRGDIEQSL